MKKTNKGFTLMEMLIVVAIIAVLVAIAIPTFTSSLEKSKEATDAANLRAAYASCTITALEEGKACYASVDLTQGKPEFSNLTDPTRVGTVNLADKTELTWTVNDDELIVWVLPDGTMGITATLNKAALKDASGNAVEYTGEWSEVDAVTGVASGSSVSTKS